MFEKLKGQLPALIAVAGRECGEERFQLGGVDQIACRIALRSGGFDYNRVVLGAESTWGRQSRRLVHLKIAGKTAGPTLI